jgi:plasmid stabilization system protein ParE
LDESGSVYTLRYAPIAEIQIEAALLWWSRNRPYAPGLLAREIEAGLDQLSLVPQTGRRVRLSGFPGARRLLLRRSGYHLYYVILEEEREVRLVWFRHARRRLPTS